jgi:NADPH:quinone reductase
VLLKGCAIVGVFWGDFTRREPQAFAASVGQLGKWYADGKLRPHVSETYPLARAAAAIRTLASRGAIGKVLVVP